MGRIGPSRRACGEDRERSPPCPRTRACELRSPDARAFEDVLDAEPVPVPEAPQPQGEAIAYTADGRDYLLGGEGVGSPLYLVSCAVP